MLILESIFRTKEPEICSRQIFVHPPSCLPKTYTCDTQFWQILPGLDCFLNWEQRYIGWSWNG